MASPLRRKDKHDTKADSAVSLARRSSSRQKDDRGITNSAKTTSEPAKQASPPAVPKQGQQLCFTFLVGKCKRQDCPDRHPDDQGSMREKMQRTPCALGANCKRKDCFYMHPKKA